MTKAETRNLLTNEHGPSEDTIEGGLVAYVHLAEDGVESRWRRRDTWLIRLSDALQMKRRVAGVGFSGIIIKVSLLFGCILLAIWIFWHSGTLPARWLRFAVRYLCRRRAVDGAFSQIDIGSTRTS